MHTENIASHLVNLLLDLQEMKDDLLGSILRGIIYSLKDKQEVPINS